MKSRLIEDGFEIGGIPTVVVDPHHHVLPTWFEYFENQKVNLVHIDRHSDLWEPWNSCVDEPPRKIEELDEYVKSSLWEGCFIQPAVYFGLLDSVYIFDPRSTIVGEYLRPEAPLYDEQLTAIHNGNNLCWLYDGGLLKAEDLAPRTLHPDDAIIDISDSNKPLLLDIDLDALECWDMDCDEDLSERAYRERFDKTFQFIESINKRPSLITIARSQNPNQYVNPRKVNRFLRDTIDGLDKLYER